ncbi:MAG: PIN domain-containing protein [Thermoflexibacteraceae bacterium]|jgi:tRNA(fMet)-specific endonuclease VapC
MRYLLDTNIVLLRVKSLAFKEFFDRFYAQHTLAISVVTLGELESIAVQNKWGQAKIEILENLTNSLLKIDINNQPTIKAYAEIDAYSQGRLTNKPLPTGMSARNMGKNDLWIAAAACIIEATLLTTDQDFLHLDKLFFNIEVIDIQRFV